MNRRAQVTAYVLVGIVILILVVLFLFRKAITAEPADALGEQRLAPVKELVMDCAEASLERLIREAAANGGYLDTSSLRRSALAWDSDVVELAPQAVPYWTHVRPCASSQLGCEATAQPPLCRDDRTCPVRIDLPGDAPSVQEQLEEALPSVVEECLGGFESLSDEYEIERTGDASARVYFMAGEVRATLEMPVKVTDRATGQSTTIREFTASADVDLPRIYRLSNEIAQAERTTAFVERLTLHLLAIYSGVDTALPPMRAVELLGQKRYWSRTNVERVLQEEVLPWADFIQVPNAEAGFRPIWPEASNLTPEEERMYAGIFYYLYVKPSNETYDDVSVRFFYPRTRPYLSINGGQELLKPRSAEIGGLLQRMVGLFINDYRFSYDLAYPVVVTLRDESAFGGEGLDWSFALEANIRRNAPLDRSSSASSFLVATDRVDPTAPRQRVENTLIIRTKDRWTEEPLPYTRVSYRCGDEFFIGETDGAGELETRLPYCRFGGALLYSKEGYLGSGLDYDNYEEGVEKRFDLGLWPLKNVTLGVRKRTPEDIAALESAALTYDSVRQNSHELNASDLVIINLERVKESPYEDDVPLAGFFTMSVESQTRVGDIEAQRADLDRLRAQGVLTEQDYEDWLAQLSSRTLVVPAQPTITVLLAPGEYSIDAFLLHNAQVSIPEETREFCMIGIGSACAKRERLTLNATNFTSWLSGGALLNASEPFGIGENVLYGNDEYTLYVLEQEIPATWSDLEEYKTPEDFLADKRLMQLPTYG